MSECINNEGTKLRKTQSRILRVYMTNAYQLHLVKYILFTWVDVKIVKSKWDCKVVHYVWIFSPDVTQAEVFARVQ